MEKIKLYDNVKKLFASILKKDTIAKEIIVERNFDPNHGFQLIKDDASTYLKSFLLPAQLKERINNINNFGYMSQEVGITLKSIIDSKEHDTYVKSIHSKDLDSIFEEGIRCLGTTSSQATTNPNTIEDISLQNTITKVEDLTILVELAKKHNGLSQGFNPIDGTMILQVPKGIDKKDLFYYNENTQTYNIKPIYITGFVPVDENHTVKGLIVYEEKNNNKTI